MEVRGMRQWSTGCNLCGQEGHIGCECPEQSNLLRQEEYPPLQSASSYAEQQGSRIDSELTHRPPTHAYPEGVLVIPFRCASNPLSNWYHVSGGIPYGGERYEAVEHGYKSDKVEYYGLDDLPECTLENGQGVLIHHHQQISPAEYRGVTWRKNKNHRPCQCHGDISNTMALFPVNIIVQ